MLAIALFYELFWPRLALATETACDDCNVWMVRLIFGSAHLF